MNRTEALSEVLQDPTRSERDRAIAFRALQAANASTTDAGTILAPMVELPEAQRMLAALGKKHIAEVTEDDWQAYFAKNPHASASGELIREWRYWVAPDERTLWLLTGQDHGGGLQWYWKTILDTCGGREDVKSHAWRELAALA